MSNFKSEKLIYTIVLNEQLILINKMSNEEFYKRLKINKINVETNLINYKC